MKPLTIWVQKGSYEEVAPGLFVSAPLHVTLANVPSGDRTVDVDMTISLVGASLEPTFVAVSSELGVTSTAMRVPITNLVNQAMADLPYLRFGTRDETGHIHLDDPDWPDPLRVRVDGPTEQTLQWVAYFYMRGQLAKLPPAKCVEDNLGLPRTTASNWVRRARAAGLIPVSDGAPVAEDPSRQAPSIADRNRGAVARRSARYPKARHGDD